MQLSQHKLSTSKTTEKSQQQKTTEKIKFCFAENVFLTQSCLIPTV